MLLTVSVGTSLGCSDNFTETENASNISLYGFVEKGPFLDGASILIQQLSKKLVPTTTLYRGTISNNVGKYDINFDFEQHNIKLQTIALITVKGFYQDEFTQAKSVQEVELCALVDLQPLFDKKEKALVNINVLTTICSDRINYLMSKQGSPFDVAKASAEKELNFVLNFGFSTPSPGTKWQHDYTQIGYTSSVSVGIYPSALFLASLLITSAGGNDVSGFIFDIKNDFKGDGKLTPETVKIVKDGAGKINNALSLSSKLYVYYVNQRYQPLPVFDDLPKLLINFEGQVPTATYSIPNGTSNAKVNSRLTLSFSESVISSEGRMAKATSPENLKKIISLKKGSNPPISVSNYDVSVLEEDRKIEIKFNNLEFNTQYTLALKGVIDQSQNALSNPQIIFSTERLEKTRVSTEPISGTVDISSLNPIKIGFNQPPYIKGTSPPQIATKDNIKNYIKVIPEGASKSIPFEVTKLEDNEATLKPNSPLAPNTTYEISLTQGNIISKQEVPFPNPKAKFITGKPIIPQFTVISYSGDQAVENISLLDKKSVQSSISSLKITFDQFVTGSDGATIQDISKHISLWEKVSGTEKKVDYINLSLKQDRGQNTFEVSISLILEKKK